ncbi:MAG: DUF3943 domain-containing protein [Gemmatimonadota bacterium]|nr:MAG: DUF3943 domain-containing protein [Gemmatimonadota bacterium]
MTRVITKPFVAALLLVTASVTASAQDVDRSVSAAAASIGAGENPGVAPQNDTFCCAKRQFLPAALNLIALELIPNYFNWHVADDTTAVLSWSSFRHNIEEGFEWDPNNLATNMFAHPYHGNVYYNAGRSNGYNFWESSAFAYAGSFIWEMFGENNRGAINDWAMTSLGGITIGEALHRAAIMVRDNEARGASRAFSELGGFLIDPVGGFNRAWRGEMSKYGPNPEDRFPERYRSSITFGGRTVGESRLSGADTTTGYFEFRADYGDPMQDYERPFDNFVINLQLNADDASTIGTFQVHGGLWGRQLKRSDNVWHVFSVDQLYDYANNNAYELGDMAFGATLRSRWRLSDDLQIGSMIQPNVAIVTAVSSEYAGFTGRSYDFGSGFGLRLMAGLSGKGVDYFTLGYRGFFTHTMNGAKGNQLVHFVFARGKYRLWRSVGLSADYVLYMRDSFFKDFPDIHRRNPEFRLGLSFFFLDLN